MLKQRKRKVRKKRKIKTMRSPRLKMWPQVRRMIVLRMRQRKHFYFNLASSPADILVTVSYTPMKLSLGEVPKKAETAS